MQYKNIISKKYIYADPAEYINEILRLLPDAEHDKVAGIIAVENPFIEALFKYAYIDQGLFLFVYSSHSTVDTEYEFLPNPDADVITLAFYNTIESSKTPMYFKTEGHHYSNNQISMLFNKNMGGELFLKGNHSALGFRLDIQRSWFLKNINLKNLHDNKLLKDIFDLSSNGYLQLDCSPYQKSILEIFNYVGTPNDIFYKLKLQNLCHHILISYIEKEVGTYTCFGNGMGKSQNYGELGKALDYMEQNLHEGIPKIPHLAALCNTSDSSFNKKFKHTFNQSPSNYFKVLKMKEALSLLQLGQSVKSVAYKLKYKNTSAFGRAFKQVYGKSPAAFVK